MTIKVWNIYQGPQSKLEEDNLIFFNKMKRERNIPTANYSNFCSGKPNGMLALFVLKCNPYYLAVWSFILFFFQAAIGGDGKADWDEIIDNKIAGTTNLEEIKQLADIAYRCLHKTPRKRPTVADVTHAISRIGRSPNKDETLSISGSINALGFLKRLERQQVELSHLTSIKESPPAVAWICFLKDFSIHQLPINVCCGCIRLGAVFTWQTQLNIFHFGRQGSASLEVFWRNCE